MFAVDLGVQFDQVQKSRVPRDRGMGLTMHENTIGVDLRRKALESSHVAPLLSKLYSEQLLADREPGQTSGRPENF